MESEGQRIHKRLGFWYQWTHLLYSRGQFPCCKVKQQWLVVVMAWVRYSFSLESQIMPTLWKVCACGCTTCLIEAGEGFVSTVSHIHMSWLWAKLRLRALGGNSCSCTTVPSTLHICPRPLVCLYSPRMHVTSSGASWPGRCPKEHSTCPREEPKCNNFPAGWVPRFCGAWSLNNLESFFKKKNQIMNTKLGAELLRGPGVTCHWLGRKSTAADHD